MNEQSDLLGTYSSPFGSKSISHLKTTKSGTGNGPDNLTTTTTTNSNTNKNKKPVDNNNKENEFDQLKMMNRFNALSGAVAPSPSCGGGHSSSSASDEKGGEYTLEAVELLDVENLLNNVKDPWLDFDLKSEVENDFDLSSWLNDGLKLEESNSKKPLNNQLGKSPQKTAFARQTSNLKNGLRPDPGTRSGISSKQSTCVGDVEDRCILPEQAIQHTLSNHNFYSSSTTSPEIKTNSTPEAYKQQKHGFLTFGDVKSEFGIRKYTEYSTKDETELNRTFDVISGHQEEANHSQNNNDESQQDNRGDPQTPSAPIHGSLLNKSFDDVISVVTSSGDFQSSSSGQKNISKSQDMASLWMGGMGRDSLTKLNDIKDVQNVARMQADHLRQTIRMKCSLPSRRLSHSTDRLKYTSIHNINISNNDHLHQDDDGDAAAAATDANNAPHYRIRALNSDSEEGLHQPVPHVSLVRKFSNCQEMNLPHPFSLPSMVGRPRLSFQHFNSSNRLQSQTGSQPLRPPYAYSSKMLSNTNESCSNNSLSAASELKSSLQAPSLLRNFSSTITSSSSIDRSKQNCSISNSSSKSNSPTFQVAPQLQQHQQHLPQHQQQQQQQQYQRQQQQQQHPQQQSQLTRSSPSPSLTSSTSKVIRTPSKLSMLQQPSKLAMKSNSKMLSSSSGTAAPKNALAYDAVDAADADYNNVSNCSSQSNESSNSSCSYRQNTTAAKSFLNASHVSNHTSLKPAPSSQDISKKRICNGPPIKPCYNGNNTNASIKQPPQPTSANVDNKQSSTSSSSFSTSSTTATTTTKSIPRMSSIPRSRLKPPTKLAATGNANIN